jgi:hypothetical protein
MTVQSRYISLACIGADASSHIAQGIHLRIGFDPRMGFPSKGFQLYSRPTLEVNEVTLDFGKLGPRTHYTTVLPGLTDGRVNLFHGDGNPQIDGSDLVSIDGTALGVSFRKGPHAVDAGRKVRRVTMRFRTSGSVEARGYDDRHDGIRFQKVLVDRASGSAMAFVAVPSAAAVQRPDRRPSAPRVEPERTSPGMPLREIDPTEKKLSALSPGDRSSFARMTSLQRVRGVLGHITGVEPHTILAGVPDPEAAGVDATLIDPLKMSNNPTVKRLLEKARAARTGIRPMAVVSVPARGPLRLRRAGNLQVISHAPWTNVPPKEITLTLDADLITLVEITGTPGTRLLSLIYCEVDDSDWKPMELEIGYWQPREQHVPMLLPIADPPADRGATYPTDHTLEFLRTVREIETVVPAGRIRSGLLIRQTPDDIYGDFDSFEQGVAVYLGPEPARERYQQLKLTLRELIKVPPHLQSQVQVDLNEAENANGGPVYMAPLAVLLAGAVDPTFARLAGLLVSVYMKYDIPSDYKVEAEWGGVKHCWITHDVRMNRDKQLCLPAAPDAIPVPAPGRPGRVKTNVRLCWNGPSEEESLQKDRQYAAYHVFRRRVDQSGPIVRLTESIDELTRVRVPRPIVLPKRFADEAPGQIDADDADVCFTDQPPAYGTYDYGLQAMDIFGRKSDIAWRKNVQVQVLLDPRPVSNLFACYLDTSGPDADMAQNDRVKSILAATGNSNLRGKALVIELSYSDESLEYINNTVERFEVHYRHGRLNQLPGVIQPPQIIGPPPDSPVAEVSAELVFNSPGPFPTDMDAFNGKLQRGCLWVDGDRYAVESAQSMGVQGAKVQIKGRRDYLPEAGEATLIFASGGNGVAAHPAYVDPVAETNWHGFDLGFPTGTSAVTALKINANTGGRIDPLPPGMRAEKIQIRRTVVTRPGRTGGQDWKFQMVIRDFELPVPEGLSRYAGVLTVRAVSTAQRLSPFVSPAVVERRVVTLPEPLTGLGAGDFIYATRPDFNGRIGVRLSWPKQGNSDQFRIFRLEIKRLLMKQQMDFTPYQRLDAEEKAQERANVKLWGGMHSFTGSYTLITSKAIRPKTDPRNQNRWIWTDRFSAPIDGQYLYRIQPIDGNLRTAPWPLDPQDEDAIRDRCILALQKSRDRVAAPNFHALEALDRAVGVVIDKPASPDLVGLWLYKTDREDLPGDARLMTLIHGMIPFDHPRIEHLDAGAAGVSRIRFVDGKVTAGRKYFYRAVFEDRFGNRSDPSGAAGVIPQAFSPPAAPALALKRVSAGIARLDWKAHHGEGEVRVQRRVEGRDWENISDSWLNPTDQFIDSSAVGRFAYRLKLRDYQGRMVYSNIVVG